MDFTFTLLQAVQDFPSKHFDSFDRLGMAEKTRAANDVEITKGTSLALEIDDLPVHGIGVAGEKDTLCDGLLWRDRHERGGILGGGLRRLLISLSQI